MLRRLSLLLILVTPAAASAQAQRITFGDTVIHTLVGDWQVTYEPRVGGRVRNVKDGGGWSLKCDIDRMFDSHSCTLVARGVGVSLGPMGYLVMAQVDRAPGSKTSLRIDRNPARSTAHDYWSGADAQGFVAEMRKGNNALIRWTPRGAASPREQEASLAGFSVGIDMLHALYASIKPAGR